MRLFFSRNGGEANVSRVGELWFPCMVSGSEKSPSIISVKEEDEKQEDDTDAGSGERRNESNLFVCSSISRPGCFFSLRGPPTGVVNPLFMTRFAEKYTWRRRKSKSSFPWQSYYKNDSLIGASSCQTTHYEHKTNKKDIFSFCLPWSTKRHLSCWRSPRSRADSNISAGLSTAVEIVAPTGSKDKWPEECPQ
jgi:hypothetical protein